MLHHRPHHDAECGERLLEQVELRQQIRLDAGAGLVSGPHVVAERFDDVIGGHAHVRRDLAVQHAAQRAKHAAHRRHLDAVLVLRLRHCVVVAEQLVGSVDEMNNQK